MSLKIVMVVLIIAIAVVIYYYMFSNKKPKPTPKPEDKAIWRVEEPEVTTDKFTYDMSNPPIVYDRYIKASTMSNLRKNGNIFRGDLPIEPLESGWFAPSVHPDIDLNRGMGFF
jgi:uncharacterized secreted protein with C-terminal beta-propeller domain